MHQPVPPPSLHQDAALRDPNIISLFIKLGAQKVSVQSSVGSTAGGYQGTRSLSSSPVDVGPSRSSPPGTATIGEEYRVSLDDFRTKYKHLGVARLQLEEILYPYRVAHTQFLTLTDFVAVLALVNPHKFGHSPTEPAEPAAIGIDDLPGGDAGRQLSPTSQRSRSQSPRYGTDRAGARMHHAGAPRPPPTVVEVDKGVRVNRHRVHDDKNDADLAGGLHYGHEGPFSGRGLDGPMSLMNYNPGRDCFDNLVYRATYQQEDGDEALIRVGGKKISVKGGIAGIAQLAIGEMDRIDLEKHQQASTGMRQRGQLAETYAPHTARQPAPPRGQRPGTAGSRGPILTSARPSTARSSSGKRLSPSRPAPLPRVALLPPKQHQRKTAQGNTKPRRSSASATRKKKAGKADKKKDTMLTEDLHRDYHSDEECVAEVPPIEATLTTNQMSALGRFHQHKSIAAVLVVQAFLFDHLAVRQRINAACAVVIQRLGRGYLKSRSVLGRLLKRTSVKALATHHLHRLHAGSNAAVHGGTSTVESSKRHHVPHPPPLDNQEQTPLHQQTAPQSPVSVPASGFVHPVHRMAPIKAHQPHPPSQPEGASASRKPERSKVSGADGNVRGQTPESGRHHTTSRTPTAPTPSHPKKVMRSSQRRSAQLAMKERAAKTIQRFCSALLCRIRYRRQKREVVEYCQQLEVLDSITLIQTMIRGRISEKRRAQVLRIASRKAATAVIQRAYRCHRSRRILKERTAAAEAHNDHRAYFERFEKAVVLATTMWQRYRCRQALQRKQLVVKMYNQNRERKEKQWSAAQTLLFFSEFLRTKRQYQLKLRALATSTDARVESERRDDAATTINKMVRGHLCRKHYRAAKRMLHRASSHRADEERIHTSIELVQLFVQQRLPMQLVAEKQHAILVAAATKLQWWMRGRLAVLHVRRIQQRVLGNDCTRIALDRNTQAAIMVQQLYRRAKASVVVRNTRAAHVAKLAITRALRQLHPQPMEAEKVKEDIAKARRRREKEARRRKLQQEKLQRKASAAQRQSKPSMSKLRRADSPTFNGSSSGVMSRSRSATPGSPSHRSGAAGSFASRTSSRPSSGSARQPGSPMNSSQRSIPSAAATPKRSRPSSGTASTPALRHTPSKDKVKSGASNLTFTKRSVARNLGTPAAGAESSPLMDIGAVETNSMVVS